jgi:hypothetical protein
MKLPIGPDGFVISCDIAGGSHRFEVSGTVEGLGALADRDVGLAATIKTFRVKACSRCSQAVLFLLPLPSLAKSAPAEEAKGPLPVAAAVGPTGLDELGLGLGLGLGL